MPTLVLIVEDELEMAKDLAEFLANYDLTCDVISQYQIYDVLTPDFGSKYKMVITDLYMADITGTSVYNEVKEVAPHIPVVLFSADPLSTLIKFDDVIQKPFQVHVVESILERHGLIQRTQRLNDH